MRPTEFRFGLVAIMFAFIVGACTKGETATDAGVDANDVVPPFIGGPCETQDDCPRDNGIDAALVVCLTAAGGYCTLAGCIEPGFTCPGVSQCFPSRMGVLGFCLNPCVDDVDCRPGFECYESISTGLRACRAIPDDAGVDAGDAAGIDGG